MPASTRLPREPPRAVEKSGHATGGIDELRLSMTRGLYRCYRLVLFRRYLAGCKKNLARIDRALERVIRRDEETTRKLRRLISREAP